VRGPTEPVITCCAGTRPAGTSGPTACVGAGAVVGETEVTDDSDEVAEGADGERVVKPPHAAVKSTASATAATLGRFMAEMHCNSRCIRRI
jgi:hypothetical protein